VLFAGVCDATLDAVVPCLEQLREATRAAGGRVIKTIGEDLMALFPSPDAAAAAAAAMQKAIEGMPEGASKPGVRVGFHTGPVLNRGGDVFGDTVNLAARLAQQAIREQIITGQLDKWYAQVCLLDQPFRDEDRTVAALITDRIATIGENIVVRRFTRYALGEEL